MSLEVWQITVPAEAPLWFKQYHDDVVRVLETLAESVPSDDDISEAVAAHHVCDVTEEDFRNVKRVAEAASTAVDRTLQIISQAAEELRPVLALEEPPRSRTLPDVSAQPPGVHRR